MDTPPLPAPSRLKLGTRQSPLAMAQAHEARARLCHAHGWDEAAVALVPVVASGDKVQDRALAEIGGKALWTRELDQWLAAGRIDAAVHLMERGREVHVLSRGEPWGVDDPDPSRSLSPHTRDRLRRALLEAPGQVRFYKNADIRRVVRSAVGYELFDDEGTRFESVTRPILCTGFVSALEQPMVRGLWEWRAGQPVVSEEADESTVMPGLFYSGPSLQHRGMLFCFIYKFRSRFGVIAREIAERLGREWQGPLGRWRERGFMMDDLSCCADCQCAVEAEESEHPEVLEYAERA